MVKEIEKRLLLGGIENARGEARELFRFCSDKERLEKLIEKRLSGYPLQYILGEWDFYDLTLYVGEGVLIPRPDTETLVEAVMEQSDNKPIRLLDLCSGSGAIVLAIANRRNGEFFALEKSPEAFSYLEKNNEKYGGRVNLIKGDLFDLTLLENKGKFDFITANPPYLTEAEMASLQREVSFEPSEALYGGENGLLFYEFIAKSYKTLLKKGGRLVFEIGFSQGNEVYEIMKAEGYSDITVLKDLAGKNRVIYGTN